MTIYRLVFYTTYNTFSVISVAAPLFKYVMAFTSAILGLSGIWPKDTPILESCPGATLLSLHDLDLGPSQIKPWYGISFHQGKLLCQNIV